jgi:hypothetical protein
MLPQLVRERDLKTPFPVALVPKCTGSVKTAGRREVSGTLVSLSDANAKLLGFEEYFLPDDHDCSQKSSPTI